MGKFTSICHRHLNSLEHRIYLKTREVSKNVRKQLYCCRIMKCITAKRALLQGIIQTVLELLDHTSYFSKECFNYYFVWHFADVIQLSIHYYLYKLFIYSNKKLYVIVCSREKSMWSMPKFFPYRRCWTSKYQQNGTGEWLGV